MSRIWLFRLYPVFTEIVSESDFWRWSRTSIELRRFGRSRRFRDACAMREIDYDPLGPRRAPRADRLKSIGPTHRDISIEDDA